MIAGIFAALGGLGLFLIGMSVMTEGLKSLAGDALRNALARFTKSPLSGAAFGAIGTAILQSSSATTVMAVGFVGAGLMTFSQSLGIIFGANVGTTITGWLVALLGFKLNLTEVVMPLVFVGALMRLLGKKHVAAAGYAVAGFGLVFAGISMLQQSMEGFSDVVTPQSFPPNTILGRFFLVLIGAVITLVTQSSSAGVATAITAVHVGTISLPQAAAMVIGMNVGTTFTAAMAAVGGTVNARRTGFAHVIYNLMTGVGAFLCLTLFIDGWDAFAPRSVRSDPEIALVSFHTLFNAIGMLLVLPFTRQFARLIERLVPAHEYELTRRLDQSLLDDPNVAIDSVEATLRELASAVFQVLASHLSITGHAAQADWRLNEVQQAVEETRVYLSQMTAVDINESSSTKRASALHLLDHLARLIRRCRMTERFRHVRSDQELREIGHRLATAIVTEGETSEDMTLLNTNLERLWTRIDDRIEPFRRETIQRSTKASMTTEQTLTRLDAIRWLRRVCYHAWRIAYHLDPQIGSELIQETELTIEGEPEDLGA